MKKSKLRKVLKIKRGGRVQLSEHGASEKSIQIIRAGKVCEDVHFKVVAGEIKPV